MTVSPGSAVRARIDDLARYGDAPALLDESGVTTYAELDELVSRRLDQLGETRRLVLLECANALQPLVTYLAALRGGHPVLLVPGQPSNRAAERVLSSYEPDVVGHADGSLTELRPGTRHDLHPDLAVLLGTSGSTGTPKLVRLSHDNLNANATAIAGFLGLGAHSRAATTLPLQYCYGLSVVNSHLLAGGSLWLTEQSVSSPDLWAGFARAGATSLAGVPYTFELLERSGIDWAATPGLRQVTQAGGRMPADRVRAIARRGEREGFDLFVMYGQTEATARMAYLPPHLAASRPETIGVPIEGGEFRLDDGELVYTGANVMLGYAESPADLALGATLTELRTGDLAVQHDDGLYEVTGRRSRVAKLFGTRLDLDLAERMLGEEGIEARLVADERALRVFHTEPTAAAAARAIVTGAHCLPPHAVETQRLVSFPVTENGKTDYAALRALPVDAPAAPVDVASAYAGVFGRAVGEGESFVSLGGDSLSYVETYVRLERLLGKVPADWPGRTVAELSALEPGRRRRMSRLETPLLLRALAILLIVGSHVDLWELMGGAHALLAIFGFNLARFALDRPTARERLGAVGRLVAEMMLPATLWVTGVIVLGGGYHWPTALALNNVLGEAPWTDDWRFWFLEASAWTALAIVMLLALRPVAAVYQRRPFAVALGVLAVTFALHAHAANPKVAYYSVPGAAWFLVLGWLVACARTTAQRLVVSGVTAATIWGYFDDPRRELLVIGFVLTLLWVPRMPVPRLLGHLVATIASASLFVYVTHWQVYPPLEDSGHRWLALLASFGVGLGVWALYTRGRRAVRSKFLVNMGIRRSPRETSLG
ncbi:MAG: AMP-binding protein [Nocardioidaceae bacterium]|nr:AMP-binding protein [Nocardioidaceae bacterium]